VQVKPRAARSAIVAIRDGVLQVSLHAAPAEGEANDELVRLLAKVLGVRRSAVAIVVGPHSRRKVVAVATLEPHELRQRLCAAL
jgi:uncharacterized protein (TIGR00251 family)